MYFWIIKTTCSQKCVSCCEMFFFIENATGYTLHTSKYQAMCLRNTKKEIFEKQPLRELNSWKRWRKANNNMTELMKQQRVHASLPHAVIVTQYVPTLHVTQNLFIFFFVDVEKQEMTTCIHWEGNCWQPMRGKHTVLYSRASTIITSSHATSFSHFCGCASLKYI